MIRENLRSYCRWLWEASHFGPGRSSSFVRNVTSLARLGFAHARRLGPSWHLMMMRMMMMLMMMMVFNTWCSFKTL